MGRVGASAEGERGERSTRGRRASKRRKHGFTERGGDQIKEERLKKLEEFSQCGYGNLDRGEGRGQ